MPSLPNETGLATRLESPGVPHEQAATPRPSPMIEDKIFTMMKDLLEDRVLTKEDNFFLVGGHSLLGMQLLMRLRKMFGVDLNLQQLFEAPTVTRLSLLVESMIPEPGAEGVQRKGGDSKNKNGTSSGPQLVDTKQDSWRRSSSDGHISRNIAKVLPPGVLGVRPEGSRDPLFWCHYLGLNLARSIGDDQPFYSVILTAEDLDQLGEAPPLESIAAMFTSKIVTTQPHGPYNLGGFCLGGILAYEIALQLQAAGHEVGLLIMLDTPNTSFLRLQKPLSPRITEPRYLLRRLRRLGPRKIVARLSQRFTKRFGPAAPASEEMIAQEILEAAAAVYEPPVYEGKVLLLLAGDHPAHINFVPGWQAVVPSNLHVEHFAVHHDDLALSHSVTEVGNVIAAHMAPPAVAVRAVSSGPSVNLRDSQTAY